MREMAFLFLTNFALLFFVSGCNDSVTEPDASIISGKYDYRAYDKNNNLVASGFFTISVNDSVITGTKEIQDTGSEHQPEVGNGDIHGKIIGQNEMEIFLLDTGGPTLAIYGNYKNETVYGKRVYWSNTGVGIDPLGSFNAVLPE